MSIKFYISKSSHGLFQSDINSTIPEDCIEISEQDRQDILTCLSYGGEIRFTKNSFSLKRNNTVDDFDYVTTNYERSWRDSELRIADIEILKLEDSGGDTTKWRKYRQLLRDYPSTEGFPSSEFRPRMSEE